MLNITNNTIDPGKDIEQLKSRQAVKIAPWHISSRNLILVFLGIFIASMFLPWTQNVRATGQLTTLRPEQRPQTIHGTIAGRIEHWYVMEGQEVKKGDTIVYLSEVKTEYFDPRLVGRTQNQVEAKEEAILSYQGKADALSGQIEAMNREMRNKLDQIDNKIRQMELKVVSDSIFITQTNNDVQIAQRQYDGAKNLYDKGLEPLTKLEERRLKLVTATTKLVKAKNDFDITKNELNSARIERQLVQNEFAGKIAKSKSERFSTVSEQLNTAASVNKLLNEQANYALRSQFYYITAPQDGYIIKAMAPGIGEIIKEGAPVVSILPKHAALAVEMYVKPIDIPLMHIGSKVRFMFDGWPAFFFSGWPGLSLGTYSGEVVAIDRNISPGGKFRVLVSPSANEAPWPEALRVGGGAKGIALLNNVPLWYEIWRMLNGFPPDMYQPASYESATKSY